jgi:hypothetical protein
MKMTRACLMLLASLAIALAGCGGSSESTLASTRAVERLVQRWQFAVADRNVGEACALLDGKGRAMLKRELSGFVAAHETGSSCAALIGFLHDAVMTSSQRTALAEARPVHVSIASDRAKVRTGGADFLLTRRNGRWRISEIPLATSHPIIRLGGPIIRRLRFFGLADKHRKGDPEAIRQREE